MSSVGFKRPHEKVRASRKHSGHTASYIQMPPPTDYLLLSGEDRIILNIEVSRSNFLETTTALMPELYSQIGDRAYMCNMIPGVYGIVYFGTIADLKSIIEDFIGEKLVTADMRVHIYTSSCAAAELLHTVGQVFYTCAVNM